MKLTFSKTDKKPNGYYVFKDADSSAVGMVWKERSYWKHERDYHNYATRGLAALALAK